MYRVLIHRIGRRWPRTIVRALLLAMLLLGLATAPLRAQVTSIGDVLPADDPFNPGIGLPGEGLPEEGNRLTEPNINDPQPFWESDFVIPGYTDVAAGIVVGQKAFGRLDILGQTGLRNLTMVIGDEGALLNGQIRSGTGFVLIEGLDAFYNNDYNIFPPGVPTNINRPNARENAVGADEGYDLYVGRFGQGTMEIRDGGRAEIQDQTIIGALAGSTGNLLVEGFAATLLTGGFDAGGGTSSLPMLIGPQGIGTMTIQTSNAAGMPTSGGTVVSEGVAIDGPSDSVIAAIIGAPLNMGGVGSPPGTSGGSGGDGAGGYGTVNVRGEGSRWIIGGSLQIGGYHDVGRSLDPNNPGINDPFFDGRDALYDSTVGRGTLRVSDGGLVSVRAPIDFDNTQNGQLRLLLGRFGRLELAGGQVNVGDGLDTTAGAGTERVALLNDGVITGSGRINTGRFWNRYYGEVRVGAGQSLIIDSASQFEVPISGVVNDLNPLQNWGLIEVIGTQDERAELEFVRAPASPENPSTPLINTPINQTLPPAGPPPTTFEGGMISAQWATLRFSKGNNPGAPPLQDTGPGLINESVLAFTAGTNIISGFTVTRTAAWVTLPTQPNAFFLVTPGTTVVVEDDITIAGAVPLAVTKPGIMVVGPFNGTLVVLDQATLTLGGVLNTGLSFSRPSEISAGGDLALGGTLNVTLDNDVLATLGHGSTYELMSFGGQAFGVDNSGAFSVPSATPLAQGASGFSEVNVLSNFSALFPSLDAFTQRIGQSIYLTFLDPGMVGVGAMGADFNGDGIVDSGDLAIWLANVGITKNASVLQGDADGDGDVDGNDFLYWQRRVGMSSAAAAALDAPSNVPEPSALVLLACASLFGSFARRRRHV